jgi:hypothetical protein
MRVRMASSLPMIPDEISAALGHAPDWSQVKGQELVGKATGKVRIAKFGMWKLCAPDAESGVTAPSSPHPAPDIDG